MGIRIRIQLFPLMRIWIRIQLSSLMLIRIQLLFKVMESCDDWSIDHQGLHFELVDLDCERPEPSTALFRATKAFEF
jgi:hypothetical protein